MFTNATSPTPFASTTVSRRVWPRHTLPVECAVFTAMEGTLLDFDSFDFGVARPLVRRMADSAVPVVPVTMMTLEHLTPLLRDVAIDTVIVEAGGAIARRSGAKWNVQAVGPSAEVLLDAICAIESATGAHLLVYSALPEGEAAALTGLSGDSLRASMRRRYSEPFLIAHGSVADVASAAATLGFSLVRGKRFFHLVPAGCGTKAFDLVRGELRCATAIGVGGAPIDAGFLSRADIPVIVPRPDGRPDPELIKAIPDAIVAREPGSAGWASTLSELWGALAIVGRKASVA